MDTGRNAVDVTAPPHLSEYEVPWSEISEAELQAFDRALDAAPNEAAMQAALEENTRFLTQHLTAASRYWIIPQRRLGAEHVTDFMIAELDSDLFNWTAVELERPQARMFTGRGDPSAALTHALRQISDWRTWLSHNRDYATRKPTESGLGLVDIDPELDGLVIIGRDSQMNLGTENRRRRLAREMRVRIHTYDWLARQARERLTTRRQSPRDNIVAATLANLSSLRRRDDANKVISETFDGIGTVYTTGAAMERQWESLSIEMSSGEYSVVYEEALRYSVSKKEETLLARDWEDWLESPPFSRFSESRGLFATEYPPSAGLQRLLTYHSENIWFEIIEATLNDPTRVHVLLCLPPEIDFEDRRNLAYRAKQIFVAEIPTQRQSVTGEIISDGDP